MSEINVDARVASGHRPMGFPEFVVVIASIMALNPLAMDMMLPALPNIGAAFHLTDRQSSADGAVDLHDRLRCRPVRHGTVVRPLRPPPGAARRHGRLWLASLLAIAAPSFETLLLARALQGLGTSATRVIATSIVRDCYAGRRMASVMSLAMMVFIAVPVLAPSFGQAVLLADAMARHLRRADAVRRGGADLDVLRLPETLPDDRAAVAGGPRRATTAFRQTVTNRQTLGYALTAGGVLGSLFAFVFTAQQVFTEIYQARTLFSGRIRRMRLGTAIAGFINSRIVDRLGMRVISHSALMLYIVVAGIMLAAAKLDMLPLPLFMALSALMMFSFGLMISNFTALAMEPQGHIAGTASSLYGSITTLIGIVIGTTIGQDYDGTLLPFATGFFLCTLASLAVVLVVEKGRLFKPHHIKV